MVERRKKVNFFLVGGMKCGSTTLHDYLSGHPEIFMSPDKEPGFFVPEIWKDRDESEYFDLFTKASSEKYIGESSTFYSKIPTFMGVPKKIHRYNNNAKILYIVRNPCDRAVSHYFHHRRNLMLHAEKRSIMKAIKQDELYIAYSDYARQIKPYINLFGKENVKVIKFESLIENNKKVLAEVYSWLEIDPSVLPEENKKSNAKPQQDHVIRGLGLMNKLRYSKLWNKLSPWFPPILKEAGNTLATKKENLELSSHEREQVNRYFRPITTNVICELGKITGVDYGDWLRC